MTLRDTANPGLDRSATTNVTADVDVDVDADADADADVKPNVRAGADAKPSSGTPKNMGSSSKKTARRSQDGSETAPKKRRRRVAASGAADDCFACAKRSVQCDRRRPYCSQCLEIGRECSGYKTKLTWDVGVASRGKLRGLSLPVMGAKPAHEFLVPDEPILAPDMRVANGSSAAEDADFVFPDHEAEEHQRSTAPAPSAAIPIPSAASAAAAAAAAAAATAAAVAAAAGAGWASSPPDEMSPSSATSYQLSSGSWGYSSSSNNNNSSNNNHRSCGQGFQLDSSLPQPPRFMLPGPEPMPSYPGEDICAMQGAEQQWPYALDSNTDDREEDEEVLIDHDESTEPQFAAPGREFFWNMGHTPSFSQMLLARSVGRTPRLKYLISYYAEVIAPVIVAFDSPSNPFRTYILSLAQESEALQEAIATLASSNLKQRRLRNIMSKEKTLPARMSSMAHRALTDKDFQDRYGITVSEGFNREELHHRGLAVRALNAQLADPTSRLSDSVLATLLVLCLYHICDTGVAQFKTQFAGVLKLLAMRMRNLRTPSNQLKWFIRIFTWFDTMTATINDREVQLRGMCLDTTAVSDGGEWSLENLVGLDGSLFKLIAQLGRLNLLSQSKKLDTEPPPDIHIPTTTLPPSILPYSAPYSFDSGGRLGCHAAANPLLFSFHASSSSLSSSSSPSAAAAAAPSPLDGGAPAASGPSSPEFWAEWYSLRQRLVSWRLDLSSYASSLAAAPPSPSTPPPSSSLSTSSSLPLSLSFQNVFDQPSLMSPPLMSPPLSPSLPYPVAPQHFDDLCNISESFRHSALLYTERLACPTLPSSHPRFQNIVQVALRYISAVQSDVYLLWPLFITGAECVLDEHRDIIRNRCSDIENDSGFFNNISCLELLEKIWVQDSRHHLDGEQEPPYPSNRSSRKNNNTTASGENSMLLNYDHLYDSFARSLSRAPNPSIVRGFKWQSIIRAKRDDEEYMVV